MTVHQSWLQLECLFIIMQKKHFMSKVVFFMPVPLIIHTPVQRVKFQQIISVSIILLWFARGCESKEHLTMFFHRTPFSDYSCSSMEYAVQENHRHMNFLSSGKIIWILAESCVLYFIVIISRIITAQQIQYNEIKKLQCWTK